MVDVCGFLFFNIYIFFYLHYFGLKNDLKLTLEGLKQNRKYVDMIIHIFFPPANYFDEPSPDMVLEPELPTPGLDT